MLQEKLRSGELKTFAVCMFDCNDLKVINDQYGHEKGDIYLKAACNLICRTFPHSPVFRVGGDEFTAVLQNEDLRDRRQRLRFFDGEVRAANDSAKEPWEEIHVAKGVAVYDATLDHSVEDVLRRADDLMYCDKKSMKLRRKELSTEEIEP